MLHRQLGEDRGRGGSRGDVLNPSPLSAVVALLALAGCGGDRPPTSPTPAPASVLAPGDYFLQVVAVVPQSDCVGPVTTPVLSRSVGVSLRRDGTGITIAAIDGQGDLTIRLTERDPLPNGLLARIEGTGHGIGHTGLGLHGPALSLRLAGNRIQGTATPGGASGEIAGPLVFVSAGTADVTCATGRWSMGRAQP